MQRQDVNLGDVMTRAAEAMQGLADKADVVLRVTSVDAPLHADPDRITEVLTNLLRNAIEVTPVGGTVSMDAQQAGTLALIWVRDEGPGIAADRIEVIFEEGLAIVRGIVQEHGGNVWAESVPPLGTTFLVQLPVAG